MKTSPKVKVLIYTVINLAAPFFSAFAAIQGKLSLRLGITIYLASAAFINLLFWLAFRIRDNAAKLPAEGKEAQPAKVSIKLKVVCYTVLNVSTFFFSAVTAIQEQMSLPWAITTCLASAAWINFLLWLLFRMKEKRSL